MQEKAFDKIQHPLIIKTLTKNEYWGNISQHDKFLWQTHMLNSEKLKTFR